LTTNCRGQKGVTAKSKPPTAASGRIQKLFIKSNQVEENIRDEGREKGLSFKVKSRTVVRQCTTANSRSWGEGQVFGIAGLKNPKKVKNREALGELFALSFGGASLSESGPGQTLQGESGKEKRTGRKAFLAGYGAKKLRPTAPIYLWGGNPQRMEDYMKYRSRRNWERGRAGRP